MCLCFFYEGGVGQNELKTEIKITPHRKKTSYKILKYVLTEPRHKIHKYYCYLHLKTDLKQTSLRTAVHSPCRNSATCLCSYCDTQAAWKCKNNHKLSAWLSALDHLWQTTLLLKGIVSCASFTFTHAYSVQLTVKCLYLNCKLLF